MSEVRLISLVPDGPPGFAYVPQPARRELRRWPFALYTRDFRAVEQYFGLLFPKLTGLIVTDGCSQAQRGLQSRRLGSSLWLLEIAPALLPQLPALVRPHLEMLETLRSAREDNLQIATQLERTRADRARLAEYFAATQARSRVDLREHARWMVEALGAVAAFGAETAKAEHDAIVEEALALLVRDPFRYRGAALVAWQSDRWVVLHGAGHPPPLEGRPNGTDITVSATVARVPVLGDAHVLVIWRRDTSAAFSAVELSFFRLFGALLSPRDGAAR